MAQIYWKTYTQMFTALIFGILLAVGHHMFYSSLSGKPADTDSYRILGGQFALSKQEVKIAIGTLFAFLVKAALALAVAIAYTQVVWKAVKRQETSLLTVDTLFSILGNVSSFLSVSVWWKYPLLLLLAITVWLIPIASIVTPATLTIAIAETEPIPFNMMRVPNVDFLSLNFASMPELQGLAPWFVYSGPRYAVDKVVRATAVQGTILPISAPAINSSWTLEFPGPSLTCIDLQGATLDAIIENVQSSISAESCPSYGYIAWTPTSDSAYLPFMKANGVYTLQPGTLGAGRFDPDSSNISDVATIYVATFPGMTDELTDTRCDEQFSNAAVIQCALFNVSYHASFNFVNGAQTVNITNDRSQTNEVTPLDSLAGADGPLADVYPNGSYVEYPNGSYITSAGFNTTEVQILAYQSIMDSLGKILVGTIWDISESGGALQISNTTVLSTILSNTLELQNLTLYPQGNATTWLTLQQYIAFKERAGTLYWNGIDVIESASYTKPLRQALEELFQNITISLMTSAFLQPNISSPYAPPLTNVSFPTYQQVYVYTKSKLILAYALAIGISTIGVLIGLFAMISDGMAYSTNFSTILRTSRYAEMTTPVSLADADGSDPLPAYLAKSKVSFLKQDPDLIEPVQMIEVVAQEKAFAPDSKLLDSSSEPF